MKVLSVNVSRPRPLEWDGRVTLTGIFKKPVQGPVRVHSMNLEGDEQADLTVHGGINKAVYAYPSEHYSFWEKRYPKRQFGWGEFGENLTTEGILETTVHVGDKFQIGTAVFVAVQPRLPCYKLAGKFQDKSILKAFTESRRSGIYFAVEREGELQAGDAIECIYRDPNQFAIDDAMRLYNGGELPNGVLMNVLHIKALPVSWRTRVLEALKVKSDISPDDFSWDRKIDSV
jgi:MOSC domain-containing protein YiiM